MSSAEPTRPTPILPPDVPAAPTTSLPTHRDPKPRDPQRTALITVSAVLALVLLVGGVLGFRQHQHITDVSAHNHSLTASLHTTRGQLDKSRSDLASTKSDLSAANATISDDQTQLASCSDVVRIADHEYYGMRELLGAIQLGLNSSWVGADGKINQANGRIDSIKRILHANGVTTLDDLYAVCAPSYTSL